MKHLLKAPISKEQVLEFKLNDIIYLSGKVFSIRDQAMKRILDEEKSIHELEGAMIYNCGPLARKNGQKWDLLSAGPTTSSRMNDLAVEFIKKFKVHAIIGKGGMNTKVLDAMKGKCVYLSAVGGSGAISANQLKILDVEWLDLGMPEAFWKLDANNFGPLIVTMDAHGNSLYDKNDLEVDANLQRVLAIK
ncbi:fumarate hydratase C-terminal domain-containing protein [Candidatus Micrarchaeota archaeon]|nr:fumarate hydratase C-terminal domain-containing protein [Candidatus Micrarchaeota archaeon]